VSENTAFTLEAKRARVIGVPIMTRRWTKVIAKTIFWLAAEIALGCIGLDDLADYGEFVFEKNPIVPLSYA